MNKVTVGANQVRGLIEDAIRSKKVTEQHVADLMGAVKSGRTIDYHRLGYAFIYLYHWANYFKVRLALYRGLPSIKGDSIRVLDLGCGSGASTTAFLDWIRHDLRYVGQVGITLVDRCQEQLDMLRALAGRSGLFAMREVKWRCEDALEFLSADDTEYDFILEANYLCAEGPVRRVRVVEAIAARLKPEGRFVVVERSQTGVFQDLAECSMIAEQGEESIGQLGIPDHMIETLKDLGAAPKARFTLRYAVYSRDG